MRSVNTPSSSKKRVSEEDPKLGTVSTKIQKVHPFFTKQTDASSSTGSFEWHTPLGPKRTCLHGTNLAHKIVYGPKIAAFDLDGTLIVSTFGKGIKRPKGKKADIPATAFEWWNACVPQKLEQAFKDGFSIVIVSNQATGPKQVRDWKVKVSNIAQALPEVPFRIFAATSKDGYRKPLLGIFYALSQIYSEKDVEIDRSASFFVGDAAGRPQDFAGTDRKWAINAGLPFCTPEEYFLDRSASSFNLEGFTVSSLRDGPPLIPQLSAEPEIVVFVGWPCLGKSTFYHKHFKPAGYAHINQDILGSRPKCIKAAEKALTNKQSCVIDNTNRNIDTRKYYIDLGVKMKVPVRCFKFHGSSELARHNNLYRAYTEPTTEGRREALPSLVFNTFEKQYEEPNVREGFSEVITIEWVFEGDKEEQTRWAMWHQIDGR